MAVAALHEAVKRAGINRGKGLKEKDPNYRFMCFRTTFGSLRVFPLLSALVTLSVTSETNISQL